jgi:hypothetical protein
VIYKLIKCEIDLKGTGCEDVEWIHVAQDRDHGNEVPGSMKGGYCAA